VKDCLTINVQFPSTTAANSNLPVFYWIFRGAFEFGSTQTYDANELISTSVARGKDTIYVSLSYRVGEFGFLAGK
jgi:carboxylesterase type B